MRCDLGEELAQRLGVAYLAARGERAAVGAHVRGARAVELAQDLLLEADAEVLVHRVDRPNESRVRVGGLYGAQEEDRRLALVEVSARDLDVARDDLG